MDIRGKRRTFVPVSRTGGAEQAPKLGQNRHIENVGSTPQARYTAGQKVLGAMWKVTAQLKVGSSAAIQMLKRVVKKLEPITYHLQPPGRFLSRLWRTPVVIRIRKFLTKILQTIIYALKTVARFVMSWPVWLRRGLSAALIIGLIATGYLYFHNQQYKLSTAEQRLLALPSVDLKMVKETKDGFTYNHQDEQTVDGHSITAAAAQADSTGKFPYEVTLPHNESAGIKFSDSSGDLGFTMKPNFNTAAGREDKGRVIYPEGLNSVHAYTFKRNGIKEDIILSKAPSSDTYTKSWTLDLGDKLEAKLLPNGAVGIYSADSMLFGNIQADNPKDQALIDKARKNGKKDNLAFVIPAPYLSDTATPFRKQFDGVKFSLKGNILTLTVGNMKGRLYPLSIDPTLVVTTTADFLQGSDDDGMIDWSTTGQINRSNISYGATSSLTRQLSAFTDAREGHTSFVYNGYLYIVGGLTSGAPCNGYCNDVNYCPLSTDGSVGTCTQQLNAFTTARSHHSSVVYNNYLYIIGGYNNGTIYNDIQYCPINSNGSVGTCTQQLNAFTGVRYMHTSVVNNGYLYIIGGSHGTSDSACDPGASLTCKDIQYCPLHADGSVGSCTQQTNILPTVRASHSSVIYNGYLYIIGGYNGSGLQNDILHCPFNSDGSVGACVQQTSAFTTARGDHASFVYNGYLYIIGGGGATANATGCNAGGYCNDIQYCPLNAFDGSVGACTQQLNTFTNPRYRHTSVAYNGYFYIIGGWAGGGNYYNDIHYGLLGRYGSTSTATMQSSAFGTLRDSLASVVYNGNLYIIGGFDNSSVRLDDIQFCPLSANGSIGTCHYTHSGVDDGTSYVAAAFTTARAYTAAVTYNGYLYLVGGSGVASAAGCDASNYCSDIQYCPINTNGTIGTCTQQLSILTGGGRYGHIAAVNNGYLYVVGGYISGTRQNDILYCPFNSNGSVGTCTRQTSAFTSARAYLAGAINNGYLYIVGGSAAAGATGCNATTGYCNDIIYCPINTNGSVGTCTQQLSAFTSPRLYHSSIILNNYIYILGGNSAVSGGGCDSSGQCSDIQYCPINSNGSVGTCTQQLTALAGGYAKYKGAVVTFNGYLYFSGGDYGLSGAPSCNATGGACNGIMYMPIVGSTLYSVGSATQQTGKFGGRRGLASVAYNGNLYIIGGQGGGGATGCDANGFCNDIYYCPLNSNGSVGTCTQQTNAFTTTRSFHAAVAFKGYLYILGGFENVTPTYYNDIQYCPINSNGSVGACTQQTNAFTTARYGLGAVAYNDYLYIIGGATGSGSATDIQYCPINSNGSVGACTQQTGIINGGNYIQSATYNGYLYVLGGSAVGGSCNGGQCSILQYCPINSNGSVGTCTTQQDSFIIARQQYSIAVYGGYLYITGGTDLSTNFNDIQYCPLNSNGSVGICFQQTNAFTSGRYGHAAVINNGYLYISGGLGIGYLSDIQYLKITDRGFGSSSAVTQQTNRFTTARNSNAAAVYNGYLYVIGGDNASIPINDIQYCQINADGSVNVCTQQSGIMFDALENESAVAYNGYLYISGGSDSAGNYRNDIQHCSINANGSIGTCTQQTNAFARGRAGHSSVIYNGYLYIVAGVADVNGTGCSLLLCDDVQYCPINSNGSVGTCTQQTSKITAEKWGSAVAYNGYLYVIGGFNNGYLSAIQYCPINSNGSVGTCIKQDNILQVPARTTASVVYNGYLYVSTWGQNDLQTCSINSNGSIGICNQKTAAFTTTHAYLAAIVNNGYMYLVGGDSNTDIQYVSLGGPQWKSHYERTLDAGSVVSVLSSIVYNGSTKCSATITYKTAGSNGIFGTASTLFNTLAGTTYTINQVNARYLWVNIAMDDSTCGTNSNITDVTLSYYNNPSAPTLISPANGATGIVMNPVFQMKSSDPNNDYIRYKIEICSVADCSSVVRTVDQTSSQTGWSGQDTQSGTAYVGSSNIAGSTTATYTYQPTPLSDSTTYYWRAYAIDPGGDNVWSPPSSIYSFATIMKGVNTPGGVNFVGGVHFGN